MAPAGEGGIRLISGVPESPCFFSGRCAGQQIRPMRASIKLLHLGENLGGVPRPVVPYGTLPCPPGGRVPLAPGRQGTSGPWAAGKLWPLGGRGPLAPGHLPDPPRWSSHGFAGESPASGRDSGRARGDSRGSFRLEWLRIEFWRHPRSLFSKPTLELRRLAPARGGGIRWISEGGVRSPGSPVAGLHSSGGAGAARLPVGNRANSRPGFVGVGPNWPAGGWRSPGSLGGPGGGGWRSAGSPLALAGEGSGIRGDPSEFKGRPIARLNRIGNLRASVEEFLEFARRGSANGTPLEVDSGGRFSSASGGPRGPPWNFSGRCAGHGG